MLLAITTLMGTSYSLLKTTNKGTNVFMMKVGTLEVIFLDDQTNELTLENNKPITDETGLASDKELSFTIQNTGTLPARYSIYIEETSTNPEMKNVIRFSSSKNSSSYKSPKTLGDNNIIDTATLSPNQTITYKVKVWLSEDADISYMNKTFTARIVVDGEINIEQSVNFAETVIDNLVSYSISSSSNFSGGLVAINSDGTLYNEADTTETIREYRYSGPTVNNYVFFDTDEDSVKDGNEIWRIIGVFKNSNDEWNIKLMRNTVLTSEEIPNTYTYDGTIFTLEDGTTGGAYWNKSGTTDNSDWTTAGIQYYLNGLDGYSRTLVDTTYTYYLGNFDYDDTAINAYTMERNTSNIWATNKATWDKSTYSNANGIALLYPSDYGYSAASSYWNNSTSLSDYSSGAMNTSWMYTNANHSMTEWMLSPVNVYTVVAASWTTSGIVGTAVDVSYYNHGIRPVLNLLSTATIDTNHQGTESDP